MENASKALLIAGAILLAILIIAIGMFIYTSAQSQVSESMTSMSTQQIEGFNSQFLDYEGVQTGSQVKALIGRLIANGKTYEQEAGKVPGVSIEPHKEGGATTVNHDKTNEKEGGIAFYSSSLSTIRSAIETKHKYKVSFDTGESGLINKVTVTYNTDDTKVGDK